MNTISFNMDILTLNNEQYIENEKLKLHNRRCNLIENYKDNEDIIKLLLIIPNTKVIPIKCKESESCTDLSQQFKITKVVDSESGKLWYKATEVGRILGLKNIRTTILQSGVRDRETKMIQISAKRGGMQSCIFISEEGIKNILNKSRKPFAKNMALVLGMNIHDLHSVPIETTNLTFLLTAFNGHSMELQYPVGKFRIDLYLKKYNIAVECDEPSFHRPHTKNQDNERENFISEKLGCTFVRFRPSNNDGMYMAQTINTIMKLMYPKT